MEKTEESCSSYFLSGSLKREKWCPTCSVGSLHAHFLIHKSATAYQIAEDHALQPPTKIFWVPPTMTGPCPCFHLSQKISETALLQFAVTLGNGVYLLLFHAQYFDLWIISFIPTCSWFFWSCIYLFIFCILHKEELRRKLGLTFHNDPSAE